MNEDTFRRLKVTLNPFQYEAGWGPYDLCYFQTGELEKVKLVYRYFDKDEYVPATEILVHIWQALVYNPEAEGIVEDGGCQIYWRESQDRVYRFRGEVLAREGDYAVVGERQEKRHGKGIRNKIDFSRYPAKDYYHEWWDERFPLKDDLPKNFSIVKDGEEVDDAILRIQNSERVVAAILHSPERLAMAYLYYTGERISDDRSPYNDEPDEIVRSE